MNLSERGEAVTISALARVAGVTRPTIREHFGEDGYTLKGRNSKGVSTLPIPDAADHSAASATSPHRSGTRDLGPPLPDLAAIIRASISDARSPDAWVPCPGDCGTPVHPGQTCRPCAAQSVAAWVAAGKPRGRGRPWRDDAHRGATGPTAGKGDAVANPRDGP
jgi:hypothetical protein